MARDNVAVLVRLVVGVTAVAVGVLAGRLLFVRIPDSFAELLGVLLTVGVALAAIRATSGRRAAVRPRTTSWNRSNGPTRTPRRRRCSSS